MIVNMVLMLLGLGQPQDQQTSLYKKIIVSPNAKNGYEDYLRAADLLSVQVVKETFKKVTESPAGSADWLSSRRLLLARLSNVNNLISEGNKKVVFDPRTSINSETLFPELAAFKNITKNIAEVVPAQFASGNPSLACKQLLDTIIFSENILNTGVLITYLVGTAMESITFRTYAENLERIPVGEWQNVISFCNRADSATAIRRVSLAELNFVGNNIDVMLSQPGEYFGNFEDVEESVLVTQLKALTPSQKAKIAQKLRETLSVYSEKFEKVFAVPEREWEREAALTDRIWDAEQDPLVRFVWSASIPVFWQSFTADIKRRTQLRLLRLHAMIQKFKWESGRLPKNLDEIEEPKAVIDPLTDKKFSYEILAEGYALFGDGNQRTGRIDLFYKGAQVQSGPDGGGP